ncbi:hypothetical protein DPMN_167086 [Dreissena polymorpha]|uniref:Uncharacterized protein n=1 Tax=Dreissena polymorpha TaxID=45954 RepID=A0A9D4EZ64_DREPO|nr:hypothetical protein DPMN_167086 [Dreissena polymorpha]
MNLLSKFHEDRTINEASITNLLTKFHEDWPINVASRVLTRKNASPPGGQVFKATKTIFELIQDIIGTNLLTKLHDDRKINVTSRVPRPRGVHVFQPTGIIFELVQDIIGMNLLAEFYEDRTIMWPLESNVTIFELIQDIIDTNLLTRFHQDWTINMASRPYMEKCPAPGGHVFQSTGIIFELIQDIIGMNLLTKFHENWTTNVASRVLTRFYYSHIRKNAPPLGSHVFQAKVTIFELIQDISGTSLLTKFHDDRKINVASRVLTRIYYSHIRKNAPPPGGHVFQPTGIIFELVQDIIGMNLLTKFYVYQTINVAFRVLTIFYNSHIRKNAPLLGSHVF